MNKIAAEDVVVSLGGNVRELNHVFRLFKNCITILIYSCPQGLVCFLYRE